jgi:hypothetical protein
MIPVNERAPVSLAKPLRSLADVLEREIGRDAGTIIERFIV